MTTLEQLKDAIAKYEHVGNRILQYKKEISTLYQESENLSSKISILKNKFLVESLDSSAGRAAD